MLISILVIALVVVLLLWFVYWLPLPPTTPAFVKPILYLLVIIFAIYELLEKSGVHL